VSTRGVLYVHSATPAVTPHIEWAVAGVLSTPVRFEWLAQPASPGAGRLASALIGWPVRFEVTEDPSQGCDGERFAFTPGLGLFHAMTSANGDLVIPENRLRQLLTGRSLTNDVPIGRGEADAEGRGPLDSIRRLLGEPWDDELEPFRYAGEGAPVRWLHQVV